MFCEDGIQGGVLSDASECDMRDRFIDETA